MVDDVVRQLGYLCLGSRLKRIGERLQADVQRFIEANDLPIQTGHYPLLAALDRHGPLTVGELVHAVGASQPGVTRYVGRMAELGLVETRRGARDQRHRTVALSAAGRRLVDSSKRHLWPAIEAAVAEICDPLAGPLLDQLGHIEDALNRTPLDRRAALHTDAHPAPDRALAEETLP